MRVAYWIAYAAIFAALIPWLLYGWPALHELLAGGPPTFQASSPDLSVFGALAGLLSFVAACIWVVLGHAVLQRVFRDGIPLAEHGHLPGWGWLRP